VESPPWVSLTHRNDRGRNRSGRRRAPLLDSCPSTLRRHHATATSKDGCPRVLLSRPLHLFCWRSEASTAVNSPPISHAASATINPIAGCLRFAYRRTAPVGFAERRCLRVAFLESKWSRNLRAVLIPDTLCGIGVDSAFN